MAADYSKACDHDNIVRRPYTKTWVCVDCGHDVPAPSVNAPPTREQAMQDARRLNWRTIARVGDDPVVAGITCFVAWRSARYSLASDRSDDRWTVVRVEAGRTIPNFATHWCDDLLGLPACTD